MKKRHIVFLLTALVLAVTMLLPALAVRISYEQKHRGYVTAIALDSVTEHITPDALSRTLLDYKISGTQTALLREAADGTFDGKLLYIAKSVGLDCAIAVYVGNEKPADYESRLDTLLQAYDIKYLLLKEAEDVRTHSVNLAPLIEKYNLTLVLAETKTQLSNECPPDFDAFVNAAQGQILRCYETNPTPARYLTSGSYDPDLIYYHMMNSARDRNTEFLLINQLTDASDDAAQNAKITQNAIRKFCDWIETVGYTRGLAGTLAGYNIRLKTVEAAGAFLGALMCIFILYILRKKSDAKSEWILFASGAFAFAVTYVLPLNLVLLYPSVFAPLGACFSFCVCYSAAEYLKSRFGAFAYTVALLGLSLASLLACSMALSAMLSGTEFYLNIYIFRGVSVTLLAPIAFALLLMYCRTEKADLSPKALKAQFAQFKSSLRPWHFLVIAAVVVVLSVYLIRSGNTKISGLENTIRNRMSELTSARPRTKEFLIGWPAVAIFAYYRKSNISKLLTWAFGAGSAILFASVMNTFCHVFTDVSTSVLRTLGGLVFSVPFIGIFTLANLCVVKLFVRRKP